MAVEYGDRYSVQQSIIEDEQTKVRNAIADAVSLAGTKGAGMMYHAVGEGQRQGAGLEGLGRMLTGQEKPIDPRLARIDALEAILAPHGTPDSYEDMVAIANDLRVGGFPGEADLAMKQANDYKTTQTNALNAKTSSQKAPTRDEVDYVKKVNGEQIVYTKTMQWNSGTQTWDFVAESPKYAPNTPTATMQDMMSAAAVVDNGDGTYGCNLDNPDCWVKATAIYHATTTKETSLDKVLSESAGEQISKQFSAARKGSETINTIDASFSALNSGDPITGFASDMRLGLAKMIGAISGDENKDVQATEVWMATTGKLVAELLSSGAFGSGTGLSDNDVKFAKAMVGGDVSLDESSIRRILYIRRQLENTKMQQWNADYSQSPELVKKNILKFYNESQIIQEEVPWNQNTLYMKPAEGFFIYKDTEYFWPATQYDVDTVTYNGQQWTVHDKNGFDLTRQYLDNLAKE